MKILHLSHTDILSDSRILKEIKCLSNINNAQLFGIGFNNKPKNKNKNKNKSIIYANLVSSRIFFRDFRRYPHFIKHFLVAIEMFAKFIIKGLKVKPDIIHCHDMPALLPGVILKWILGSKLVYDAHELESEMNGQTFFMGRVAYRIEKICWKSIDLFITVSPSIKSWYCNKFGNKNSIIILNSPITISSNKKNNTNSIHNKNYLRKKFNVPKESLIFIYVGKLCFGRGIELMLSVFSRCKYKSHLIFMGEGALASKIKEYTKKYKNIHLHSAVNHDEVTTISKQADFGLCLIENVSLSDFYSLPNKLFEYCFSGIPSVSSMFPDLATLTSEHKLGVLCDLNESSIAKMLKRLETKGYVYTPKNTEVLSWEAQERKLILSYINLNRNI